MAITLGALTLPQGLRWSDEFSWSPIVQSSDYSLTGALIVQQAEKLAGRPITLVGGKDFVWMTRAEVIALKTLIDARESMTLTLHDGRSFTVIPANDEPLSVSVIPVILDSGPANPSSSTRYTIETLKLLTM